MRKYNYKPENFWLRWAFKQWMFKRWAAKFKRKVEKPLDFSFLFDWVDDRLTGDTVIWRTGYDQVIGWNIYTWTDWFGDYINFNWNYDWGAVTWTKATSTALTTPAYTQATSFSLKVRIQPTSLPSAWGSGFYGSAGDACIWTDSTGAALFTIRWSTTVTYTGPTLSINTLYDLHLVYDSATAKFYCYVDGVLQNSWWTSGPATFTTDARTLWDNATGTGTIYSSSKAIYHACLWNVALSQAEITADIALWNTAKSDIRIVAYYIPANLAYNSQYIINPKDLSNASWTKGANTTITADYSVAPDGTTTADRVQMTWVGGLTNNKIDRTFANVTGAALASKTRVVKAFVRAVSTTKTFRLRCTHSWVSDYFSWDLTATSVRQEFTFSQAFTSATWGTGITAWVTMDSIASATDLEVWNVRCFLSNETLWDESPNIWGLIGRKTSTIVKFKAKLLVDSVDTADAWLLIQVPWFYVHCRTSANQIIARCDTTISAVQWNWGALGNWYRGKVNVIAYKYWNWLTLTIKIYINGILIQTGTLASNQTSLRPPTNAYWSNFQLWRKSGTFNNVNVRDAGVYVWDMIDSDAVIMNDGGEPPNAVAYEWHGPIIVWSSLTVDDLTGNWRTATKVNGVVEEFI